MDSSAAQIYKSAAQSLDAAEYVQFSTLMKATPSVESGNRFVYVEASKESKDQQGEIVLSKALQESAEVFRKFGVLDLDHKSMPSVAQAMGITNPEEWRIGNPVSISFKDGVTLVKASLYSGDGPLVRNANIVWDGLTKVSPPHRYYASVGGKVMGRESRLDPVTKARVDVITKTHWNNLALSLNPVNADLSPAQTTPISTFAKAFGGFVLKTLTAGYGTDSAALSGGGALREQSLHGSPVRYQELSARLKKDLQKHVIGDNPSAGEVISYCASEYSLSQDDATQLFEQFIRALAHLKGKNHEF